VFQAHWTAHIEAQKRVVSEQDNKVRELEARTVQLERELRAVLAQFQELQEQKERKDKMLDELKANLARKDVRLYRNSAHLPLLTWKFVGRATSFVEREGCAIRNFDQQCVVG